MSCAGLRLTDSLGENPRFTPVKSPRCPFLNHNDCTSLYVFANYERGPMIPQSIEHADGNPCGLEACTFSATYREHLLISFAKTDNGPNVSVL
jgi:hypothetical protein